MLSSRQPTTAATIGVVAAPVELAAAMAQALAAVKGCELIAVEDCEQAAHLLREPSRLCLLVAYAGDDEACERVRQLVQQAKTRKPAVPVVVLAESELENAVTGLIAAGAADCLLRPINLSRLTFLLDFLSLRQRTCSSYAEPAPAAASCPEKAAGGLVFASEAAQRLHSVASRLARVDSTVLLQGETGSGKSCVARLIHAKSPRSRRPLVVVNCGSVPESLIEGELFGYRQGAYTGADRNHLGKFAQAKDGTLFLDEVDSLSLRAQSSLLRVVEDRAFEPLGSDATEKLEARLVFATNRDLAGEVEAGRFRRDLFYRLNVVSLVVPTLRSRLAEIPALVAAFLGNLRARQATEVQDFSPAALAALQRHRWPGNVRELRNVVERVAVMCDREVVTAADLPPEVLAGASDFTERDGEQDEPVFLSLGASQLAGARQLAERQTIVRTLQQCAQNRSQAAQQLGISRTALYKKLHQLGIA